MLEKKLRENEDTARDWMRKAEIAVDKLQDILHAPRSNASRRRSGSRRATANRWKTRERKSRR